MKRIAGLVFLSMLAFACGGNKQMASANEKGSIASEAAMPVETGAVPPCILKMIDSAKGMQDGLGITEVRRYRYNGSRVYLVSAPCCDQFNPVYDSACNMLFSPSGGFTGKGDRSHPDFFTEAKEDSLIWRKNKN